MQTATSDGEGGVEVVNEVMRQATLFTNAAKTPLKVPKFEPESVIEEPVEPARMSR